MKKTTFRAGSGSAAYAAVQSTTGRLPLGPLLRVLAGGTMISFAAVFVKLVNVGPSTSVFYRVFFGGVALLLLALARGERLRVGRGIWGIVLAAAFFFTLDLEAWHRSILYVGPGLATILGNFQVFILAFIGAVVFKERISLRLIMALPLAIGGLWLLLGVDVSGLPEGTIPGVIFGLLTAVFYACYILTLRRSQGVEGRLPLIMNMAVVSLGTALFSGVSSQFHDVSFAIPSLQDGGYLIAYGLLCQGVGWVLLSSALPKLPAAVAGLLMLIQPTLSFIWDILLFDRPTGPLGVLGACMAIFAIWVGISGQQAAQRRTINK